MTRVLRLDPHDVMALKSVLDHYLRCGSLDDDERRSELREARIEDIRSQLDGSIVRRPEMRWEKVSARKWYFFDGERHTGIVERTTAGYIIRERDFHGWQALTETRTLLAAKRRVEHVWAGRCFTRPKRKRVA